MLRARLYRWFRCPFRAPPAWVYIISKGLLPIKRSSPKYLFPSFNSDRLREVSRLVDVLALAYGDMIRQKLQRNRSYQRLKTFKRLGHLYNLVGNLAYSVVAFRHEGDDLAASCLYLLDIAQHLLIHVVARRNDHHRHVRINKSNRSVLHLRRRIALGMDVAYLLQLQCALQGNRIAVSPSEVEEIARIGERPAQF